MVFSPITVLISCWTCDKCKNINKLSDLISTGFPCRLMLTTEHAFCHTFSMNGDFAISSSLLLTSRPSSHICTLNSLLPGHLIYNHRIDQVRMCMPSSTPNYCFAWFSRRYHQPKPSLDERAIAVGTVLVHQTHCYCAPLILSTLQRTTNHKIKGFQCDPDWLRPRLSYPEQQARHRKPQSMCTEVSYSHFKWWVTVSFLREH